MNYHNEHDPGAAEWIRELIREGLIPKGEVDERSIKEVQPAELAGFRQAHFFAGISGWSEALQLAGWPEGREVWTGSCPCQPYSTAGKQKGNDDARNLWPDFFRLIRERRPVTVFGEQVEGAIRHGWLDGVSADLEGEGYTVGACVLGAHSVGAPHIRQRLYWVADAGGGGWHGRASDAGREAVKRTIATGGSDHGAASDGRGERRAESERGSVVSGCGVDGLGNSNGIGEGSVRGIPKGSRTERERNSGGLGDANGPGPLKGREPAATDGYRRATVSDGFWADSHAILCRDNKYRRIPLEPSLSPLASGIPGRVGLLRGAGNAICVPTAAAFIKAFIETQS